MRCRRFYSTPAAAVFRVTHPATTRRDLRYAVTSPVHFTGVEFTAKTLLLKHKMAKVLSKIDAESAARINGLPLFFNAATPTDAERVQTSCEFGVPLMRFEAQRGEQAKCGNRKGGAALAEYRSNHNRNSINGLPAPGIE